MEPLDEPRNLRSPVERYGFRPMIGLAMCISLVFGSCNRCWSQTGSSNEPLHVKIDRLLVSPLPHLTAGRASDGPLLRRLSIDLRGAVPTAQEVTAFTSDADPARWKNWVSRFLADPLHEERMVDWWDKSLMQRRPHAQVDRAAWMAWLREVMEKRTPLDAVLSQMLSAPWWDNSQRPALRFFLDRGGDPHMISRDLGRILVGRDMQCAQCHDHPLVEEYKQVDYHGLFAFVAASNLVEATTKDDKGADKKVQMYVERPGADAAYESVFVKGVSFRAGARLPVSNELFEDYLEPDVRLVPDVQAGAFSGVPKSPRISRRAALKQELLERQKTLIARNMANRLWSLVFGRGLVHPVDMQHADNPPSNPELLDLISHSLVEMNFDTDRFVEQLVLTDAYCRDVDLAIRPWPLEGAQSIDEQSQAIAEMVAVATAENEKTSQQLSSARQAVEAASEELEAAMVPWKAAQVARNAARVELDKAEAAFNEAKKKSDGANAARDAAVKKKQDATTRSQLLDDAGAKLQQALALAGADDAELKQAIATAKARGDAVRAEMSALEKAASDAEAAAVSGLAAIEAPRTKVRESAATLTASQQKLAPLDDAYTKARRNWSSKQSHALQLETKATQYKRVMHWAQLVLDAKSVDADRVATELQLAANKTEQAGLDKRSEQAVAAYSVAEQERTLAASALASARQMLTAHVAQLEQLRETIRQLEKASAVVASAEALKPAIQAINETLMSKVKASDSLMAGVTQSEQSFKSREAACAELLKARELAEATRNAHLKMAADLNRKFEGYREKLQELSDQARDAWDKVLRDQQVNLAVGNMRPQSPEQLGLSILRATNVLENYISAELAELHKAEPLPAEADAATIAKRQLRAVRGALDKLRPNLDVFAGLYASGVGQTADDYFASPDQALFMSNAGSVFSWAGVQGQNVTQRMITETDNAKAAVDLYHSLLARNPSPSEAAFVVEQLAASGADRPKISQELVWSILSGVEFRFYR